MNDDNESKAPEVPNLQAIPMLYRTKRLIIPLVCCFVTVFMAMIFETGTPVVGVLAYSIIGMFLDWFYFRYKGYKDANLIGQEALQFLNITDQQLEQSITYMIRSRIVSFISSILITATAFLLNQVEDWQGTMIITYIAIATLMLLIGKLTKKIVFPHVRWGNDDNRVWLPPNGVVTPDLWRNPFYIAGSDSMIANPFHILKSPDNRHD